MAGVYPIGSALNGGILYSDGTIKNATYNNATSIDSSGYAAYGQIPGSGYSQQYAANPGSTPIINGQAGQQQGQIPSGYTTNNQGTVVQKDVNTYDPNNLSGWGINFGNDRAAYDAYAAKMSLAPQIDSEYGAVFSNLEDRRKNLQAGEQDYYNSATLGYDAQKPILQQGLDQGNALIGQQRNQNSVQEANALAAARRVYNELRQGVQQRFGASNSAGEFGNEFYGREFARNLGNVYNTSGQNSQKLNDQAQTLLANYNSQLQKLEGEKQAALSAAKDAFRQRLDQIDAMKGQALENKASMKLQELQNLRAQAAQIEAQNTAFQQQLILQHQANLQSLQQGVGNFAQFANTPISSSTYSSPSYSGFGGGQASTLSNNVTGYYDPNKYKKA